MVFFNFFYTMHNNCVIACSLLVALALLFLLVILAERFNAPCIIVDDPVLSICLLGTSQTATRFALAELNWAFYPPHMTVELFLVGNATIAAWRHKIPIRHVASPPRRFHDLARCIVVLNDTAEVSPVFAYWFYYACGRAKGDFVVSGGEAGMAFSGKMWERWVANKSLFISDAAIHPPAGYVFVRTTRQNPMEPERAPKLVRSMDLWF